LSDFFQIDKNSKSPKKAELFKTHVILFLDSLHFIHCFWWKFRILFLNTQQHQISWKIWNKLFFSNERILLNKIHLLRWKFSKLNINFNYFKKIKRILQWLFIKQVKIQNSLKENFMFRYVLLSLAQISLIFIKHRNPMTNQSKKIRLFCGRRKSFEFVKESKTKFLACVSMDNFEK
jgi:hypothetical protein